MKILNDTNKVIMFYSNLDSIGLILNYKPDDIMKYDEYINIKLKQSVTDLCREELYYIRKEY